VEGVLIFEEAVNHEVEIVVFIFVIYVAILDNGLEASPPISKSSNTLLSSVCLWWLREDLSRSAEGVAGDLFIEFSKVYNTFSRTWA
jgi:hypothetical protein